MHVRLIYVHKLAALRMDAVYTLSGTEEKYYYGGTSTVSLPDVRVSLFPPVVRAR